MSNAQGIAAALVPSSANEAEAPTPHRFSVTGTATAVQYDQTPFYNLLPDVAEGAAYIVGAATASESDWTNAAIWRYTADQPAPLVNMHITDFNNTDRLSGGKFKFIRKTPGGDTQSKPLTLSRYRHEGQFQMGVMDIPVSGVGLDGYTYIRALFQGHATPNFYNITFTWGPAVDRRAGIPVAAAQAIQGPRFR